MSVALKSASPTELGQSINSGAITRPPTVGNIDQIAIPQTAQTSNISPTTYVREFNVPGQNVTAEVPYRMPADVGDPLYRPLAGDPLGQPSTRSGRPVRSAGLDGGPINAGSAPPRTAPTGAAPINRNGGGGASAGGRTSNPGRAVNPRVPGGIGGAASVGVAVVFGGGGLGERVGTGIGGYIGFNQGAAAGAAAGASAGTVTLPGVGTVGLGGAGAVAGGIAGAGVGGAVGGRIGRAIDNAIPDFPLPWPFNGGGGYPNQTDPDAIPPGPETESGSSNSGSVSGVVYRAVGGHTDQFGSYVNTVSAPLTGPVSSGSNETYHGNGRQAGKFQVYTDSNGFTVSLIVATWSPDGIPLRTGGSYSLRRDDGLEDPVTPPVYAPNPARSNRPTVPGGVPNLLPKPPINAPGYEPGGDTPWPGAAPAPVPDTQPLAPPAPTPAPFAPSTPNPNPNTPTSPNAPPGPPDLDPSAPPREAPDLGTDPDTPAPSGNLAPVNQPDVNQDGEPYNGWIKNGEKQYGDGPIEWGVRDPNLPAPWWENAPPLVVRTVVGAPKPTTGTTTVTTTTTADAPLPTIGPQSGVSPSPTIEPVNHQDPSGFNVPNVLPVPVPVGAVQPVRTPSAPSLSGNPADNPNVQQVQQPVRQTPPESPKGTCFYEFQRVADIQRKATSTEQRAANPTSGFTGLYGIGIESRVKLGETFTLLQQVNQFMRKAWEMTRIQKILDVLTFIGVMHNVSMLSRDVGETFFQLITQGLQATGIRDEEGGVIQVEEVIGDATESFLRRVLGSAVYDGIADAWNKANRIVSSASAIIWTIRSISDASLDLMEWIGENTGRIGNALKRWGVVGERSYPWMSENARAQSRFRNRFSRVTDALENAEDRLSTYMQATSGVIEIQEETQELGENWQRFRDSVENGIPDPWADNAPVQTSYDASKAISDGPDVPPSEAQKG